MRGDKSWANIVAFVCGILTFLPLFGFLTGLVGLICGYIGLSDRGARYRTLGIIGVVLIVVAILLNIFAYGTGIRD